MYGMLSFLAANIEEGAGIICERGGLPVHVRAERNVCVLGEHGVDGACAAGAGEA